MYCPNCGAKLPDKKSKYCPACGTPIISANKTSPIIDAIILGSIIVLFIFAVIKISQLITDYRLSKIKETRASIKVNEKNNTPNGQAPEVMAPRAPGKSPISGIMEPKMILIQDINNALKGVTHELEINYNKTLNGYEVDVTIYKNKALTLNQYFDMFANVLSLCYGNNKNNVKFVICKVKDKDKIKLSVAVGAEAASKIPIYTWEVLGRNGVALVRWIEKHQTPPSVGKILMCRYYNNM
ncbi:hypothetical protein TTHT_0138 [Thermotomaculum hydrothermale]|uniref:Zinc-ribbon domain-containing protein n=1 Tax=Thermotomaculum hydrothermale TaxID=981385 RepID=A0A7R6PP41_9BACT|nr:zinc ribbon domain-containing protein [Thermotomaculum hydrothermale]BBB31781.1 hypothetical protein TTHT_0138 [Thermotomaculum hydrothermale]